MYSATTGGGVVATNLAAVTAEFDVNSFLIERLQSFDYFETENEEFLRQQSQADPRVSAALVHRRFWIT